VSGVVAGHTSFFQWTSDSNIPVVLLGDVIHNIKKNVSKLENPPSSQEISTLTKTSRTFQVSQQTYNHIKRNFQTHSVTTVVVVSPPVSFLCLSGRANTRTTRERGELATSQTWKEGGLSCTGLTLSWGHGTW
jgi:hypothetical protein